MRNLPPTIRNIYKVATRHKITIPADIRRDLDKAMNVIDRAESATFDGPTIGEAVTAALMAERNPVTDNAVQLAIVRDRLQSTQTISQIVGTATGTLYDATLKHLDRIVEVFKPVFNKAGETFTEAVEQLTAAGITKLDGTGGSNLDLARANIQAREAAEIMQEIGGATGSLLVAVGRLNGTPLGTKVNRIDTGDTPAVEILNTLQHSSNPWDAVVAGYTISLATPTETDDRAAHAYEIQEAKAATAAHTAAHPGRW